MTTPAVTLNPILITNAAGTFSTNIDGYIQGFAEDDPAVRYQLTGGVLGLAETVPMWGGVPIQETLSPITGAGTVDQSLKTTVFRATSQATVTAFSVFNQNYAAINTPQSPVPTVGNGMLVNYYRIGSNARIAVSLDPAALSSLPAAQAAGVALYWDPTNYRVSLSNGGSLWQLPTTVKLVAYDVNSNSMITSYASATGFTTWNRSGNCCILQI